MDRRTFVGAMAGALVTSALTAKAQPAGKVPRIGYLAQNTVELSQPTQEAFRQELRERGWIDGQNLVVEVRYAEGKVDRFPALVAELIGLKCDVIVTSSSATTWAVKGATTTIPIVMAASVDAPGEGLVASLAHPGGNITGMTFLAGPEIAGKQLQLLKEVAPTATRMAALANPANRSHAAYANVLRAAARSLGAQLQVVEAATPDQLDGAFAALSRERAESLLVLTDSVFVGQQRRIVDLAAKSRLPALYSQREFVDIGGLVSYGASLREMYRRAATQVDKILRGMKPGDIPVEQPNKFELVINLKTAQALGLTIPRSLALRADQLIE